MIEQIDITPSTGVYGTYKRLSYKPWYAVAEFVDNSTQSYYDHKEELQSQEGFKKLYININYSLDNDYLEITDTAFGMDFYDFKRALILDKPPKNNTGRNEFGMGLKTAACWFGNLWTVETTRLGENEKFKATIDVSDLQENKTSNIDYSKSFSDKNEHYTKIYITSLNQKMVKKTLSKIKEHLSSIYRNDIRNGEIDIIWNGESLTYNDPSILVEEFDDGTIVEWKKNIDFEILSSYGKKYNVNGWIGLMDPGSTSNAGFTLMRRGRVIIGGPGENYRPDEIFGKSNSFTYQRLFGEINLDNWEVTQAKDGFDWNNGLEELLIENLLRVSDDYRRKAEKYRKNESKKVTDITEEEKSDIVTETVNNITSAVFEINEEPVEYGSSGNHEVENVTILDFPEEQKQEVYSYSVDDYDLIVKWYSDNENGAWITSKEISENKIEISLNIRHAFFVPYINDTNFLKIMNKLACAMIIAERNAKKVSKNSDGSVDPSDIRTYMNKLLDKLSKK